MSEPKPREQEIGEDADETWEPEDFDDEPADEADW
jgi:hypothetical protein